MVRWIVSKNAFSGEVDSEQKCILSGETEKNSLYLVKQKK